MPMFNIIKKHVIKCRDVVINKSDVQYKDKYEKELS